MLDIFGSLFDTTGFPARWHCGIWSSTHGWTHIISDWLIFGAYFAIPLSIAIYALKRKDLRFPALYWLFAAFILACGLGHLIESFIFWKPMYRLSAASKVLTAIVSWTAVVALIRYLPTAVRLPGAMRLAEALKSEIQQREKAETHLRILANTVPSLTFAADRTGHFDFVNDRFTAFTGCTAADLRDSGWNEVTHPDEREATTRLWKTTLEEGRTFSTEIRIRGTHGDYGWFLVKAVPVTAGDGMRWIGCATDVTEAKEKAARDIEFERHIRDAQRLESLGVLAGGIAHDFNNLLTGIVGNTSLAQAELPDDSPLHMPLQRAELAASRAAELCRQMLAYSGRGQFQRTEFNISRLMKEASELITSSMSKKATMVLDLAPDLSLIKGDPSQVRQIAINLLINASESLNGETGIITVRTRGVRITEEEVTVDRCDEQQPMPEPGHYVCLEVSDSGCGMTPETVTKMFEPFFSTKFTGRGLGLSAVQGIVRGHGGSIQVHSEVNTGTRITVYFPALPGSRSEAEPVPADESDEVRYPAAILVIEDEEEVRQTVEGMLTNLGIQGYFACNGREGVDLFHQNPSRFPLVLLDLTMPVMDGAEAAREIKKIAPSTQIILMSGYDCAEAARNLKDVKPDRLLQKPFAMEALKQSLSYRLPLRRASRRLAPRSR